MEKLTYRKLVEDHVARIEEKIDFGNTTAIKMLEAMLSPYENDKKIKAYSDELRNIIAELDKTEERLSALLSTTGETLRGYK